VLLINDNTIQNSEADEDDEEENPSLHRKRKLYIIGEEKDIDMFMKEINLAAIGDVIIRKFNNEDSITRLISRALPNYEGKIEYKTDKDQLVIKGHRLYIKNLLAECKGIPVNQQITPRPPIVQKPIHLKEITRRENEAEYVKISRRFLNTLEDIHADIVRIVKITNAHLEEKFNESLQKCPKGTRTEEFFYGPGGNVNPEKIYMSCEFGFDINLGNHIENGKKQLIFTKKAFFSHLNAFRHNQKFQMLLAYVIVIPKKI